MKFPCLLILNEKHGKWYLLLESQDDLVEAAITTVQRRNKEGWYHGLGQYDPKSAELLEHAMQEDVTRVQQAKASWALMNSRIDSEYEGFDLEYFDNKPATAQEVE